MNAFDERKPSWTWWLCALLAALLAACGTKLISDPSFELWCGQELCAPWESKGKVTRVGTWHANDYAVSLGNGAEISQRSDEDPVDCIEFELIADVTAEAQVQLELDFMDDGRSEYTEQIAESRWARLRFLVKPPSWYDGLRFRVRKLGKGRAVIAQLSAVSSSECKGEPIELVAERPVGVKCDEDEQCRSGRCARALPNVFGIAIFQPAQVCAECQSSEDCDAGAVCGLRESEIDEEAYRGCVQPGPLEVGATCEHHGACPLGVCLEAASFNTSACAGCIDDGDCAQGEVCGIEVTERTLIRSCVPDEPGPLGELCTGNAQCQSGVCCFGVCSECCGDLWPCQDGAACERSELGQVLYAPLLCAPGSGARGPDEACSADADCRSDGCELPAPECVIQGDPQSFEASLVGCRVQRRYAGVCR